MKDTSRAGVMVMTALLSAQTEKQEELSQTLRSLLVDIRKQPGCLECMVGQGLDAEGQFFLYLVWKNLGCMEAYLASEDFRILLGASSTLATPTAFRFTTAHEEGPSPVGGLKRTPKPLLKGKVLHHASEAPG